jgi:hypothetical protein
MVMTPAVCTDRWLWGVVATVAVGESPWPQPEKTMAAATINVIGCGRCTGKS